MKKVIETVKNAFFYTTALFALLFCIFMVVYYVQDNPQTTGIRTEVFESTLIYGAISGVCIAVVGAFKKLHKVFRYLLDFVFSYGAFCLWYRMLTSSESQEMSSFFSLSTLYVVIFVVIILFLVVVGKLTSGKKEKEKYESVFEDSDEKKND